MEGTCGGYLVEVASDSRAVALSATEPRANGHRGHRERFATLLVGDIRRRWEHGLGGL